MSDGQTKRVEDWTDAELAERLQTGVALGYITGPAAEDALEASLRLRGKSRRRYLLTWRDQNGGRQKRTVMARNAEEALERCTDRPDPFPVGCDLEIFPPSEAQGVPS